MKILFLMHVTSMDGSTISLLNLIKGLKNKGVDCYVVYPGKKKNMEFESRFIPYVKGCFPANIQTSIRAGFLYKRRGMRKIVDSIKCKLQFVRNYQEYLELKKIIESVQPDIIHSNSGVIQSGFEICKKLNLPHVWHLREYQDKDFELRFVPSKDAFVKKLHESYVITITKGILEHFQLQDSNKARYIYNGCLSEKEKNLSLPKEKNFLCCTRVVPEKGHTEIIKAFGDFHKKFPEYKLLIAGVGPEEYITSLKELAKRLDCIDAVSFLGFQKDVRKLMDNSTALIVASRFEGFGRMTAEAAIRGCMVIGKNTGGTKEILDQIGDIPYSGAELELEQAMEKVAKMDEQSYLKIIRKAQSVAVQKFSNEQNVEKTYAFYKDICSDQMQCE